VSGERKANAQGCARGGKGAVLLIYIEYFNIKDWGILLVKYNWYARIWRWSAVFLRRKTITHFLSLESVSMEITTIAQRPIIQSNHIFNLENVIDFTVHEAEINPLTTLSSGKLMAKAWAKSLDEETHLHTAQTFLKAVLSSYWIASHKESAKITALPRLYAIIPKIGLDDSAIAVASAIGKAAAQLDVVSAAFELGNLYTNVLPTGMRSDNGVFYTPPALTKRLLDMCVEAGVDWSEVSVVDPACGGGAFLAPVAIEMVKTLSSEDADTLLLHVETHLKGFEIDPFAAWLTQLFLEVALKDILNQASRPIKRLVKVCNTLEYAFTDDEQFDLVIGNPPYGKTKLTDRLKSKFGDSLYGHPNLYGLFTHLAIQMVKPNGIIGYLTPTSFLSGEYFKKLRSFIRKETTPQAIDFVAVRKGVFEDVLQETMLATYKKVKADKVPSSAVSVSEVITQPGGILSIQPIANCNLPIKVSDPWILPKKPDQSFSVVAMNDMKSYLENWGYKISTGQLVWNRYKDQLTDARTKTCLPVIWAEAITPEGHFRLRAEKKNHAAWFDFSSEDEYLLTTQPCVLLQRTTAKEQDKRLIAAVLSEDIFKRHRAVVVENHLNMIVPTVSKPPVSLAVLSAFLNSRAVNNAFRTISGSVAVSAYELESMPVPDVSKLKKLRKLVDEGAALELIEQECTNLYTKRKK